jgi:ABC-type glycerol-3-phosphate transport system substrate-binding protein
LLSLLWSNGGDYLDLAVPETLFDGPEGLEVMQLVYDLGYIDLRGDLAGIQGCYDPANPWGMWWDSFTAEDGNGRLAMMVMPPWMNYLVWAMGEEKFDANLGISPNPIGPHGTESVSLTYGWLNTVSQKAEDEGRGDAAWDFLRWLNSPKAANEIAPGIPLTGGVSPMGDFLIMDSQPPGKIGDRESGDPRIGWWLQEFIDMA